MALQKHRLLQLLNPHVDGISGQEWCRANNWLMLAVQPPGRAMRLKEPFVKSSKDLAQRLLPVVAAHLLDTPYMVRAITTIIPASAARDAAAFV